MTVGTSLGNASFVLPSIVYLGLFTTEPSSENPDGVEVVAGNYGRIQIHTNPLIFSATIVPSTSWGSIVAYGFFSALIGGNLLGSVSIYNPLTMARSPIALGAGFTGYVPTGQAGATMP